MAFGKGKESASNGGSSFVKHIGIGTFEIAAINPNEKEYEELFGKAPQSELNYVTERDNHKVARICVYLRNVTGDKTSNFITQVNFFLENVVKKGKNTGTIKVIDKYGNCRWIPQENYDKKTVPNDKNNNKVVLAEDYRACCGDEDLLVKMLRAYLCLDRPDEYVDGHWVLKSHDKLKDQESLLEHLEDYFKGDFSELKDIVKLQPNNRFQAMLGVRTTDDGKEYQDVFKHHFMQNWETNISQMEYQLNQNRDYSYSHTKFDLGPLREYFSEVTPTDLSSQPQNPTTTAEVQALAAEDSDLPF